MDGKFVVGLQEEKQSNSFQNKKKHNITKLCSSLFCVYL